MHGYGEYHWSDERLYIGYWSNDKKEGFGIHIWANPDKFYIGFWKENKYNGFGCIMNSKMIKYGLWENGERIKWFNDYHDAFRKYNIIEINKYKLYFPKDLEEAKELIKNLR